MEAKAKQQVKKRPDSAKMKEGIKQTKEKKNQELKESITKLKNFKMPKNKPKLGGTEEELEKQIHDDILDLQIQLNTDDFGKKAIEMDKKRQA